MPQRSIFPCINSLPRKSAFYISLRRHRSELHSERFFFPPGNYFGKVLEQIFSKDHI